MREIMTSRAPWEEPAGEHYPAMNATTGPGLTPEPFPGLLPGRLLRVVLATLLAGLSVFLAG
jgi:hypothetical protein